MRPPLIAERKSPIVAVLRTIDRGTLFVGATIPCVSSSLVIKLRNWIGTPSVTK
jgi:hypothetical protein